MEDVEAATLEDVQGFFRRYYVPSNASLCLVGDIEEGRAIELAERYFGSLPGGSKAILARVPTVALPGTIELELKDRVELTRVYQVWPTVAHFQPDDASLVLLADILARGRSSRLYRRLVLEEQIAQDVSVAQSGRELGGTFGMSVTLRPGRSAEDARKYVESEIKSIAEQGITHEELARVQNGRLASFIYALDSIGGFGGVADRLNAYNTYLGDPGRIAWDLERYQQVHEETVRQVAGRFLAGRPRVALTVVSQKPKTQAAPFDRSVRPASAPRSVFHAPIPEVRALRCGIPLWILPRRELPIVAATFIVPGGASAQPTGAAGLAQLTASMRDEGTASRTLTQLAAEAEAIGTNLSATCGWDGAYVSLQCLTSHWPKSLDLAIDILRYPTFPEQEWKRLQGQALASLRAERDSAEARAYRGLLRALYPPAHPYRSPIDGEVATVANFTRDDLLRYFEQSTCPSQAACVVAGDVDPDELVPLLDEALGDWSGPDVVRPEVLQPSRADHPRILVLDRPGAPQAMVRAGHVGLTRLDTDYTAVQLLNQILGGQFTSRLNAKLREEKGFTYGVRSQFDCRRGAGPFSVSAALQSDRLDEAVIDLRHEITSFRDFRPPTATELEDARRSLHEGQPRLFETPSALVSRYASLIVYGLPPDYQARFPEMLDSVTLEDLTESAQRQIHPQSLAVVVVADAARVLDPLRRLDWAEVEVLADDD
jgi:predicted Zn-dependent peptidase